MARSRVRNRVNVDAKATTKKVDVKAKVEKVSESKVDGRRVYKNIDERNEAQKARRRARYDADPEYREYMKHYASRHYRNKNKLKVEQKALSNSKISAIGVKREIVKCEYSDKKEGTKVITFTVSEASKAMGIKDQVCYRWLKSELIPKQEVTAVNVALTKAKKNSEDKAKVLKTTVIPVYTLDEMKAINTHIIKHQKKQVYFKKSDVEVVEAIKADVEKVRS